MIFFDVDGTLLDHLGAQRAAALAFHERHAAELGDTADAFADRWHTVAEKHVRRHLAGEFSFQQQRRERLREIFAGKRTLDDQAADALFAEYVQHYEKSWRLYPDVLPCLDALAGRELGIISNGDATQQRAKLRATGIGDRFAVIVVSGDGFAAKPAAAIFHAACAAAGRPPSDCTYVGDDLRSDVEGGRAAGLTAVWIDRHGAGDGGPPSIATLAELRREP